MDWTLILYGLALAVMGHYFIRIGTTFIPLGMVLISVGGILIVLGVFFKEEKEATNP